MRVCKPINIIIFTIKINISLMLEKKLITWYIKRIKYLRKGCDIVAIQESGEMYLETILILSKSSDCVRSVDVSEYMNFSKPSVSRAVGLLKDGGYINVDKNGYLTLTELGLEIAEKIYERHIFLTSVLEKIGVEKETAVQDACKIEHVISDETFEAIKKISSKL